MKIQYINNKDFKLYKGLGVNSTLSAVFDALRVKFLPFVRKFNKFLMAEQEERIYSERFAKSKYIYNFVEVLE